MSFMRTLRWISATALAAGACVAHQAPALDPTPIDWAAYRQMWVPGIEPARIDEPARAAYDPALALAFLDDVAVKWVRHNECGTCHTSVSYIIATPRDGGAPHAMATAEVRDTMLRYATRAIEKADPAATFLSVPVASALAIQDGRPGGSPDPRVRKLFDQVWRLQDVDGSWHYPLYNETLPFLERDRTYIAMLVALAAGYSPDEVVASPEGKSGLDRLRQFIRSHLPESVHNRAVLLWASVRTPGLLTSAEQTAYQHALLQLQHTDGGWTLPALGNWARHDGAPNDPHGASDGYATGLAALVLCERGLAGSSAVAQARNWLEHNQRASGRWYTRSLYSDDFRGYISNMASAYAVMALEACH